MQCLAFGWLIYRYEHVTGSGVEVRFACSAYDPYDPLRGRYLRVSASGTTTNLSAEVLAKFNEKAWVTMESNRVFVRIEPATNGLWRVAEAAMSEGEDGVWIRPVRTWIEKNREGGDRAVWNPTISARAILPDQLFVNERTAPKAEKVLQEATSAKGVGAIAVYRALGGEIVMTDIEIGGKSVVELAREAGGR